uniref:Uncharacterized protein n=1 Tax=Magallana gigas TaxID=29159 RepID=A0A8W8L615_MAGGI
MNFKAFCLAFLCFVLLFTFSDGACKKELANYHIDRDSTLKVTFYCSKHRREWSYGVMRFPEFCERCFCFGYIMECCDSGNVAGAVTVDGCMKEYHGCNAVFYKFVNGIKINCHTGLPFDDRLGF